MARTIILILLFFITFCGNVFPQNVENFTWQDLEGKSFYHTGNIKQIEKEKRKTIHFLNRHTHKFQKHLEKYHGLLGKRTIKKIVNNMEVFVVPEYKVTKTTAENIYIKLSENRIAYIIFVHDNYYLGHYGLSSFEKRFSKFNYQTITGRYTNYLIDKDLLLDFFSKGQEIFALKDFCDGDKKSNAFWFSKDEYLRPIKFEVNEIWDKIEKFDNKSNYKSKCYQPK